MKKGRLVTKEHIVKDLKRIGVPVSVILAQVEAVGWTMLEVG
ncbi:hypothetical protein ABEW00_18225 [Rossellomorea vietnamensis]